MSWAASFLPRVTDKMLPRITEPSISLRFLEHYTSQTRTRIKRSTCLLISREIHFNEILSFRAHLSSQFRLKKVRRKGEKEWKEGIAMNRFAKWKSTLARHPETFCIFFSSRLHRYTKRYSCTHIARAPQASHSQPQLNDRPDRSKTRDSRAPRDNHM